MKNIGNSFALRLGLMRGEIYDDYGFSGGIPLRLVKTAKLPRFRVVTRYLNLSKNPHINHHLRIMSEPTAEPGILLSAENEVEQPYTQGKPSVEKPRRRLMTYPHVI